MFRIKRDIFLIFLIPLMFLSCAKKEENKLTFMVGGAPAEIEYWEKLINEFKADKKIDVRIIRQPTDSDQRRQGLIIPLGSKQKDPDIFLMDVVWIGQFAASDWLEPLDGYIKKEKFSLEPFFTGIIDFADSYKGTLYAMPVNVDGGMLYYRKDLLKKYGYDNPPETWKDFVEYSKKVQAGEKADNPNFYAYVWQGAQYEGLVCTFLEYITTNNGGIVDESGEVNLNTAENIEALQLMRDIIHTYKISPPNTFTEMKEEEVRTFFQQGNALFERNWPYAWKLHESEDSFVKGKTAITTLPHFPDGKSASTLGGWHVGISKYSDAKDESWEFVKFVTSFETEKKFTLNLGWNPSRADVYDDKEVIGSFPHLPVLKEIFKNAVPRPNIPYYTQVSQVIQVYVNQCLSGTTEPKEALDKLQEEVKVIINEYNGK